MIEFFVVIWRMYQVMSNFLVIILLSIYSCHFISVDFLRIKTTGYSFDRVLIGLLIMVLPNAVYSLWAGLRGIKKIVHKGTYDADS